MEEVDLTGLAHNATPSWNGYNHQGKVALYRVLKMINNQRLSRKQCSEYELELDYFEDFSILKKDEYVEAHQVKTYSDVTITKYNDAIWALLAKAKKFRGCNVYLHTTVELKHSNLIKDNVCIPKEEFRKNDTDLLKPYECYQLVTRNLGWESVWEKFSLFDYDENKHCSLESIKRLIEDEIQNFECDFSQNITRAYSLLLRVIDLNVCARHIQNQDNIRKKEKKERINFEVIYDLLNNNHNQPSLEYCISALKDRFNESINNYFKKIEIEEEYELYHRNKEHELYKKNLLLLFEKIMRLEDTEFLRFCTIISPQQLIEQNNIFEFDRKLNELFAESEMMNGYFPILDKIEQLIHENKYCFLSNKSSYLPSTIVEDDSLGNVEILIDKILTNSKTNDELLYEVDYIINKNIKRENLVSTRATRQYEEDIDKHLFTKITKIKQIRLIDLENAKKEFLK